MELITWCDVIGAGTSPIKYNSFDYVCNVTVKNRLLLICKGLALEFKQRLRQVLNW